MGLEKWEDSDLRIKGSGSKKSPRSRSEEKGILEAYLEEGGGVTELLLLFSCPVISNSL